MKPSAHVENIEGQTTLVVKRTPPLPQKLDRLIADLFNVSYRNDPVLAGARPSCEALRTHRFVRFREGRHLGTDRVLRDLALRMCADCGAVEVRDVGFDRLDDLPTGGQRLRRRNEVIGWYSGRRRNSREHR